MTYINDLRGIRFGRLVALEYIKGSKWVCQCDCGNVAVVRTSKLTMGNTKSCKCYRNTLLSRERTLGSGYAAFREVVRGYRKTADTKGIVFDLDEDTCHKMMQQNCHYCGVAPRSRKHHSDCFGDFIYNGIDRINSTLGYTINNVVTCCKICNYAKNSLSLEEFRSWIDRIYLYKQVSNW